MQKELARAVNIEENIYIQKQSAKIRSFS